MMVPEGATGKAAGEYACDSRLAPPRSFAVTIDMGTLEGFANSPATGCARQSLASPTRLAVTAAWGDLDGTAADTVLGLLDRILASLWRLTHP